MGCSLDLYSILRDHATQWCPSTQNTSWFKESQNTTTTQEGSLVLYIAGDTLRHQPIRIGHVTYVFRIHPMGFWVTQAVNQSQYAQRGLVGVSSTRPYLVRPILWIQARAKRSGSSKSSIVESETVKSVKSIRDSAREEWFDDTIFDTKRIKHPPKVKKEAPPEGSISCLKCNSVFDTVDKLTKHEKGCYVKYSYECMDKKCTQTFSQKSLMNQHYWSMHMGKPFECSYCEKTFMSKKSRDRHEKSGHLSKDPNVSFKYNCDKCEYKTDDKTEYTSHVDHHQEFKRYKCGYCDEGFYSQSHLTNHITNNRCKKMPRASNVQQKKEECSRCGKTFKSRAAHHTHFFDKHVKEPDGSMKPHCEPCLVVFSTAKGLKTHCTHSVDHERNTKFL